jgi:hypothetical protein
VRLARDLLVAAYPELRQGRLEWLVEHDTTGITVTVREAVDPLSGAAVPEALLKAMVELDDAGSLVALRARGPLARPPAFIKLREALAAGGAMPSNEVLKSEMAQFVEGETDVSQLVKSLPRAFLAEVGLASFQTLTTEGGEPGTWTVDIVRQQRTADARYVFTFEPFEGRLLSVVRR